MYYEERIQSVLHYIETHVHEDIACESLAAKAGFSKSHFLRVFEAYTGFSVMSYVRGRKLYLAAERLRLSTDKVADIAYDYGFESHDVFGRAFKRMYGITPDSYRRRRFIVPAFHAVDLAQRRTGDAATMTTKPRMTIVTKPAMKLIGIECRMEDGMPSTDLWKRYFDEWQQTFGTIAHLRVEPEKDIDYALSVDRDESGYTYFIGIEVTRIDNVPLGTSVRLLPRTKYASFTAVGPVGESIGLTYDYIFKEWFPGSTYQTAAGPIMEHYDLRCATHLGMPPEKHEMDIYIPIEPALSETKEIIELRPYRAACYKAIGKSGRRWHQVKKEAFDVMIDWALSQGMDQSELRVRAYNNGGAPEDEFYYEVHMDITDRNVSCTADSPVSVRDIEGGSFIATPALHRMLEPTGKAFCDWFDKQETYSMTGNWFEEYIIHGRKVTLDTLIMVHFGVEKS